MKIEPQLNKSGNRKGMTSGRHKECRHLNGKRTPTPEYRTWQAMRNRVANLNSADYPYYGGRGIRVCQRWGQYENFLEDMGRRPSPQHTLDRINSDGDYEPSNCRWATRKTQAQNRPYAKVRYWELMQKYDMTRGQIQNHIFVGRKYLRWEPVPDKLKCYITKGAAIVIQEGLL